MFRRFCLHNYLIVIVFFAIFFSFNLSGNRQLRKLRGKNESESDSEEEVSERTGWVGTDLVGCI